MRKIFLLTCLLCLLLGWQQLSASTQSGGHIYAASHVASGQGALTLDRLHAGQSLFGTAVSMNRLIDDALSEDAGFDIVQIDMADLSEIDVDKIIPPSLYYILPSGVQIQLKHHINAYIRLLAFWLDKPPQAV